MQSLNHFTSLPRELNLSYPSHAFALSTSLLVGLVSFLLHPHELAFAVSLIVNTFLVWAIIREINPIDSKRAGFGMVAYAIWALLIFNTYEVSTLGFFITLLIARLVIRPTGYKTTKFDAVLIASLVLLHATAIQNSIWLVVASFAFYIDWKLDAQHKNSLLGFVMILGGFMYSLFTFDYIVSGSFIDYLGAVGIFSFTVFSSVYSTLFETRVIPLDNTDGFMSEKRLFLGRLITILCIMSLYFEIIIF